MEYKEILKNICYTELVYGRINKKLNINLSKEQIEEFIFKIIKETEEKGFFKNWEKLLYYKYKKQHQNNNKFKHFQSHNR